MTLFKPNPDNADQLLGMIKGIIVNDNYYFDDNLHQWFDVTANEHGYIVSYQWTYKIDENGEDLTGSDSFPVLFKDSPEVTIRFISDMLLKLQRITVEKDIQINH